MSMMNGLQLHPQETWERVKEFDRYSIFLVAESDVAVKEDAFPLNYAIVNKMTNRVEGYTPTLSSAWDTARMIENVMESIEAMEEAESVKFIREDESPEGEEDPEIH